jgi:hypothetical protein
MTPELKRRVGHRGLALEALLPPLQRLFADSGRETVC